MEDEKGHGPYSFFGRAISVFNTDLLLLATLPLCLSFVYVKCEFTIFLQLLMIILIIKSMSKHNSTSQPTI